MALTPPDALAFLERKLALIIENACSEEGELALREKWDPLLREASTRGSVAWKELHRFDRELEKDLKAFVLREDRVDLHIELEFEFSFSRLTRPIVETAEPVRACPDDEMIRPRGQLPPTIDIHGVKVLNLAASTVAGLGQHLADLSGRTVRGPAALAARECAAANLASPPAHAVMMVQGCLRLAGVSPAWIQDEIVLVDLARRRARAPAAHSARAADRAAPESLGTTNGSLG